MTTTETRCPRCAGPLYLDGDGDTACVVCGHRTAWSNRVLSLRGLADPYMLPGNVRDREMKMERELRLW